MKLSNQQLIEVADLVLALYEYAGGTPVAWGTRNFAGFDWCAMKKLPWATVVVNRGTTHPKDWLVDADTIAIDQGDGLGPVHPGFHLHAKAVVQEILKLQGPVVLAGHSLGAGRTAIQTGLLCAAGRPPAARVQFGEPRPGYKQLVKLVSQVPTWSYRNTKGSECDPVTKIPLTLPFVQYVNSAPFIDVWKAPTPAMKKAWFFVAPHHMELYRAALSSN